jgi:hypothetical protein
VDVFHRLGAGWFGVSRVERILGVGSGRVFLSDLMCAEFEVLL